MTRIVILPGTLSGGTRKLGKNLINFFEKTRKLGKDLINFFFKKEGSCKKELINFVETLFHLKGQEESWKG